MQWIYEQLKKYVMNLRNIHKIGAQRSRFCNVIAFLFFKCPSVLNILQYSQRHNLCPEEFNLDLEHNLEPRTIP